MKVKPFKAKIDQKPLKKKRNKTIKKVFIHLMQKSRSETSRDFLPTFEFWVVSTFL